MRLPYTSPTTKVVETEIPTLSTNSTQTKCERLTRCQARVMVSFRFRVTCPNASRLLRKSIAIRAHRAAVVMLFSIRQAVVSLIYLAKLQTFNVKFSTCFTSPWGSAFDPNGQGLSTDASQMQPLPSRGWFFGLFCFLSHGKMFVSVFGLSASIPNLTHLSTAVKSYRNKLG